MLATVSPVMVGADAASPQPTTPSSDSMRTSTLSARVTVSPAIFTGFFIGRLTAMGSMALIRTLLLDHVPRSTPAAELYRGRPQTTSGGAMRTPLRQCATLSRQMHG